GLIVAEASERELEEDEGMIAPSEPLHAVEVVAMWIGAGLDAAEVGVHGRPPRGPFGRLPRSFDQRPQVRGPRFRWLGPRRAPGDNGRSLHLERAPPPERGVRLHASSRVTKK